MRRGIGLGVVSLLLAATALGCGGDFAGVSSGGVFVVSVGSERFRVRIDNALIATKARRMMQGAEQQKVVTGQLARGDGGFNIGYSWHMKPETVSFADATIELCDGLPSDVEKNVSYWVDTVTQYCPWMGHFISEVGKF